MSNVRFESKIHLVNMSKQAFRLFSFSVAAVSLLLAVYFFAEPQPYSFGISTGDSPATQASISAIGESLSQARAVPSIDVRLDSIRALWAGAIEPTEAELAYNSSLGASSLLPLLMAYRDQGDISAAFYISRVIELCAGVTKAMEHVKSKAEHQRIDTSSYVAAGKSIRSSPLIAGQAYCEHIPATISIDREAANRFLQESVRNGYDAAVIFGNSFSTELDELSASFIVNDERKSLYFEALKDAELARSPTTLLETAFQLTLTAPVETRDLIAELIVAACTSHLDCNTGTKKEMVWLCSLYNCKDEDDYLSLAISLSGNRDPVELATSAEQLANGVLHDGSFLKMRLIDRFRTAAEKRGI